MFVPSTGKFTNKKFESFRLFVTFVTFVNICFLLKQTKFVKL
jgi:hypothetical protein